MPLAADALVPVLAGACPKRNNQSAEETFMQTKITIPKKQAVPPTPDRLAVSPKEAAAMLGVSTRSLYNWQKAGLIHSRKVGARVLYSLASLQEFLAADADNDAE